MPDDRLNTEEDVKIKILLPFLRERGYDPRCMDFEKAIEVQEGRKRKTIFADVVVYASPEKVAPLILCETKGPNEPLDRAAKEQAISYARLLPRIAPIALITNGKQTQVYQTLNKNQIPALAHRSELHSDIVNFVVGKDTQDALRAEAKHELFIIDDVQSFKNILKACHNEIRNNEGYDPTIAFDEMSKVLFCKLYEERVNPTKNRFRLKLFDDLMDKGGTNVVRQIFEETKSHANYSGLFAAGSSINLQDRTIRKIVSLFENYDLSLTAFDVKGEAYEYFLGDTFTGGLGEYFTPRNVVEFIVDAVDPKIGHRIIDPFCGTGGFLIYAFEVVGEKIRLNEFSDEEKEKWRLELSNRSLYGTDWKERTSIACKMNMTFHGDGSSGIFLHHGLLDVPEAIEEGDFDVCLTNPPFGSYENDPGVLKRYELAVGRNSQDRMILAVERAIRLVKPGGMVGIIVMDGILNNKSGKSIRDYIRKHTHIQAVVSLDETTFEGYGAGAKTSVMLLKRKNEADDGAQKDVFFAVASNTGYAPNGAPVAGNELPEILLAYREHLRGDTPTQPNIRLAMPLDRLDAEYYVQPGQRAEVDVGALYRTAASRMKKVIDSVEELQELVEETFEEESFAQTKLGDLLLEVRESEALTEEQGYSLLGVRWWGGGVFHRETKLGREIKATKLFPVSPDLLMYNRLFAFRGSFALTTTEHAGGYVSGEFPMFEVRELDDYSDEDRLFLKKYLVYCLNSPQYLAVVDRLSTGSTKKSRNRLLQDEFLNMRVAVPKDPSVTRRLVGLFERMEEVKQEHAKLAEEFEALMNGVAQQLPIPTA